MQRRIFSFTDSNVSVVRMIPQFFAECLVKHFNILYKRKEVVWPRRQTENVETGDTEEQGTDS